MESYSLTRDLPNVSVEISTASMRHEFLRAEMEALLDPSELPQRVGPMEELDLYATVTGRSTESMVDFNRRVDLVKLRFKRSFK